jgi:hypothetical protein
MKNLSESILRKLDADGLQGLPRSSEGGSDYDLAQTAPFATEAAEPHPPEDWASRISSNPPAHWIEHIRGIAPELLDSLRNLELPVEANDEPSGRMREPRPETQRQSAPRSSKPLSPSVHDTPVRRGPERAPQPGLTGHLDRQPTLQSPVRATPERGPEPVTRQLPKRAMPTKLEIKHMKTGRGSPRSSDHLSQEASEPIQIDLQDMKQSKPLWTTMRRRIQARSFHQRARHYFRLSSGDEQRPPEGVREGQEGISKKSEPIAKEKVEIKRATSPPQSQASRKAKKKPRRATPTVQRPARLVWQSITPSHELASSAGYRSRRPADTMPGRYPEAEERCSHPLLPEAPGFRPAGTFSSNEGEGRWPDLPEASSHSLPDEWEAAGRERQRLLRLDQEQRGALWSE